MPARRVPALRRQPNFSTLGPLCKQLAAETQRLEDTKADLAEERSKKEQLEQAVQHAQVQARLNVFVIPKHTELYVTRLMWHGFFRAWSGCVSILPVVLLVCCNSSRFTWSMTQA